MRNLYLSLLGLCLLATAHAQTTVIINTGTAGTPAYNAGPIYRSSASSAYDVGRYAYLYTQSELAAAGIFPGATITSLGWAKNNTATTTGTGHIFRIYMKMSSATDFSQATETWANLNSGTTLVYENLNQSIPATTQPSYIDFALTTPFVYTGGSLEISTEWDCNAVSGNPTSDKFDWMWSTVTNRIYGTGQTSIANAGTLSSTTNSISTIDDRRPFIQITLAPANGLDLSISGFQTGSICPASNPVGITVQSLSTDRVDSAVIDWWVNGVQQPSFNFQDTLAVGESSNITLGTYNFLANTSYTIQAIISSVNGLGLDDNQNNDTLTVTGLQTGLSGNYTIDSAVVTGGTNFRNFTDFANALINYGVCGPVVADVVVGSGPYEEQVILPQITGASAVNTITINGHGETLLFNSANTNERAALKLNGTDHLTVDSLHISANGTYGFGVHLTNDADSNTISNCVIDINITSTSTNFAGIVVSASATSAVGTGATLCDGNTFSGNTINGGYYGITLVANGTTSTISNNRVLNNQVLDFYTYGIYLNGNVNTLVEGNDISRPLRANPSTFYGIYFTAASSSCLVSKNRVHNPFDGNTASTSGAFGIYHTACDATAGNENRVINNLVYNFNNAGTQNGLYNNGSDYVWYYHNTISLDDLTATCATCASRGYYLQTNAVTGQRMFNNNFSITRTGGGEAQGVYYAVNGSTLQEDYNNFYIAGGGTINEIGYFGGAGYATLAAWITASALDSNSLDVNPLYTSPLTGNFAPSNSALNDKGTNLNVADDILGMARNATTPDIGAFEFDVAGNDAGVIAVATAGCAGTDSVLVTVQNFGTTTMNTVRIYASVNGTPLPNNGNLFTLNLAAGTSTVVNLGNFTFLSGTSYSATAFTSLPNGNPDGNNPNDTLTTAVVLRLSGTYTINSAVATGGANFQSFTDLATALNSVGVCGPVVVNVVPGSGPYNEQASFNEPFGISSVNTVTINGANETVTASPVTGTRYLIQLNGADYFTIDSLRLVGTNATYGYGIHMTNGANFNTITNCFIDLSAVTSTTAANSCGICASGSNTSPTGAPSAGNSSANSNLIDGNTIVGGANGGPYYGMAFTGTSTSTGCQSNTITNNKLIDFQNNGIRLVSTSATVVRGNELSRPTYTSAGTFEGIYLTGTSNPKTRIEKNRLHNTNGANTISTSSVYGIDITSDGTGIGNEILVINNAIYNVNHNGPAYGLYISASVYSSYLHNTISLDNAANTGSSLIRGIYTTGTCDTLTFINNNVSVTSGSTGAKYGIYLSSAPVSNWVSNYNNFYVNGPNGSGNNYVGYLGSAQATLTDWQNASTQDANSFSVDPVFASLTTGDLTPANALINNQGLNLSPLVTDDILGNTRSATPDPGAFEFNVNTDDAGVTVIKDKYCPGPDSVLVTVTNFGAATLTSVTVTCTVNGTPTPGSGTTFTVNVPPTQTTVLNLGAFNFAGGFPYTITAYTTLPNGVTDGNAANDSATVVTIPGLAGNYTIDSSLVTGGTNFQSFADAALALNNLGVCGPVVIDVVPGSGPYVDQQITLLDVPGNSATNTITINGNGEVFRFASTTSAVRAGIRIDGTDYVTIDSLVIEGTGTYAWGVQFANQADHNTVRNCTIYIDTTSTSTTNYCGIVSVNSTTSLTTTGNSGNYNLIENNTIRGGYTGISLVGQSTTIHNVGNRVLGNTITHYYSAGVRSDNQDTVEISGNTVVHRGAGATAYGLDIAYNGYGKFSKNKVTTAGTSTNYGIYTNNGYSSSDLYNEVSNNFVSCLGGTGTTYGIYSFNNLYQNIFHNNFNVTGGSSTAGRAVYLNSSASGAFGFVNVKNNIGVNTGPGYAVEVSNNAVTLGYVVSMDNNDWYATGAVLGRYNNINAANLAAWKATAPFDTNSIAMDPLYTSATDLHVASNFLNDRGALGTGVADDIDGEVRCPNGGCQGATLRPDIGADEFLGAPITVDMGAGTLVSPAQQNCYTNSEPVVVTIRNFNSQSIDFSVYPVTVTVSVSGGVNDTTFASVVINTDTLAADSSLQVAIAPGYDMSVPGTYTFTIAVNEGSDANPVNDTLTGIDIEFVVGTIAATYQQVCSGSGIELVMQDVNGPIQWQSYDDINMVWVNETGTGFDSVAYTVTPTVTTLYRALVCGNYPSATDTIEPVTVPAPTAVNDTICGPGTATLTATGTGNLSWYSGATGGSPIATGGTFSPVVSGDTTFYVESAVSLAGNGGALKITEIFVDDPDALEIQNLSTQTLNTAGWVVAISDNYSNINTVQPILWNLPATLAPGQILTRDDASSSPNYWGDNMLWNPANGSTRGWAMIVDNLGNVVDFVIWDNWPANALATFAPVVNGFTISLGNEWQGAYHSTTGIGTQTLSRIGSSDNNNVSDFVIQAATIGSPNPGLAQAFSGGDCASTRIPVTVTVEPLPIVNLGADTAQCGGTIDLDAGNAGSTFAWSNSATTQTTNITASGNYSVTVTGANGCSASDNISVTIASFPVVNLGPDVTECGTATLDAGNAGSTYLWSSGASTQTINATASGEYRVTVTNSTGCTGTDTINVALNAIPVVNLGADSAQCGGNIDLDAGNAGATYAWSTTATTQTINVTATGNYAVTVTDANNCTGTDDVDIAINTIPTVDLGADTAVCDGNAVELDAANAGATYAWGGGETTQTITVTAAGNYTVVVTDANNCTATDDVDITVNGLPVVDLGPDDDACASLTLDAGNAGSTFAWSTGSTTQTTVVTTGGTYWVRVTNANGCTESDTVDITINALPTVNLALPTDTACINAGAVTLSGGSPMGGTYSGSGVSGTSFNPQTAGLGSKTITYTYTDNNGCTNLATDNIQVVNCVGIAELDANMVAIYPNPSSGQVYVDLSALANNEVELLVHTAEGRLVMESKFVAGVTVRELNLSNQAQGLYVVKVITGAGTVTKRIVIQ